MDCVHLSRGRFLEQAAADEESVTLRVFNIYKGRKILRLFGRFWRGLWGTTLGGVSSYEGPNYINFPCSCVVIVTSKCFLATRFSNVVVWST